MINFFVQGITEMGDAEAMEKVQLLGRELPDNKIRMVTTPI